ncbi:MAG: acyltransferase [Arcobacter sp.]|nr:acyltransferase [Arcobacter sp.]
MNAKKLDHMNLLRVFGISIVVLRHTFAPFTNSWKISEFYDYSIIADFIGRYISTLSMPLFVFISGYIYSYLRNSIKKYGTYKILITKKIRRLLIPYLFFALLYNYFFMEFDSLKTYLIHLWIGSGHLWFILMMFIMFLLFYPFEKYFKNNIVKGIIIAVVLYILVLPMHYLNLNPVAHVFKYFVYFYLGYLFSLHSQKVLTFLKDKSVILFIAHFLIFTGYFFAIKNSSGIYITAVIRQTLLILGVLSICFTYSILNTIFNNQNEIINKYASAIKTVNVNSYYIYIFHQPILKIFFGYVFVQELFLPITVVLAFLLSFNLSLIFSKLLLKLKPGRLLIGS